jgi:hypothetical protein
MSAMHPPADVPKPVMPAWSAYAGEEFNLTERRPLVILSETDESFVVDGFYHRGEFWKSVIPKRGVAEIIGQQLNFSKPKRKKDGASKPSMFFLNHVQARIIMSSESPARLYPAGADPVGEPAHELADFCYSVEAVGPHGRRWNPSDALLGNLAVVHRFLSIHEVAFERIVLARMTVVQSPPLPLEPQERDTMLCEAIRESHITGIANPYFMLRVPGTATNCTSEPLKLLDRVLRTPREQRFFHRLPIWPRGYLKLRGLWQDGQPHPTLNEQMSAWIASDEARQRRRIHLDRKKSLPKNQHGRKVSLIANMASFVRAIRTDERRKHR